MGDSRNTPGAVNECADNKNGNEGVKEADKRQKSHAGEGHFEVGMLRGEGSKHQHRQQ